MANFAAQEQTPKDMEHILQDKVWSTLPKEFKEEVKEIYLNAVEHHPCGYNHKTDLLKYLFGRHNLTSKAEGEEMLICEKSKVQRAYNTSREIVKAENPDSLMYSIHTQIMCVLESIFGSKCLPDEEPLSQKTSEKCDTENHISTNCDKASEPKKEADEHFDNILKGSFNEHNRLHIAAMIMSGLLVLDKEEYPVRRALDLADALIAKCKEGGDNAA